MPINALQELVQTRLEELGIGARIAAERTHGAVSYETLRSLARGQHSGRLADRTIEGIAVALQVPAQRVYEAAAVPRPRSRWLWPEKFDRLDLPERRLIEDLAGALLDAYEKGVLDGRRARSSD